MAHEAVLNGWPALMPTSHDVVSVDLFRLFNLALIPLVGTFPAPLSLPVDGEVAEPLPVRSSVMIGPMRVSSSCDPVSLALAIPCYLNFAWNRSVPYCKIANHRFANPPKIGDGLERNLAFRKALYWNYSNKVTFTIERPFKAVPRYCGSLLKKNPILGTIFRTIISAAALIW